MFARAYRFGRGKSADEVRRELASANPGSLVQVVRGGAADNEVLVEMLAAQTFRAESSGSMLAKKAEVDLLLRLAGTTQISKGIKQEGAVAGESFLAIIASRAKLTDPPAFGKARIPRTTLTEGELLRIERAALLDAAKGWTGRAAPALGGNAQSEALASSLLPAKKLAKGPNTTTTTADRAK